MRAQAHLPVHTVLEPGPGLIQWCLTSTETTRLIRDQDRVKGEWRWGEEGKTYRYTVTTRMTPALRWAAIGAILMFH